MARSKELNAAMGAFMDSVAASHFDTKMLENAIQTMMNDFRGCYNPFRRRELPVIIAALGFTEKSLRGEYPEIAKITDLIMEGFETIGYTIKEGGSDGA